jgi:hypothetical protein
MYYTKNWRTFKVKRDLKWTFFSEKSDPDWTTPKIFFGFDRIRIHNTGQLSIHCAVHLDLSCYVFLYLFLSSVLLLKTPISVSSIAVLSLFFF